MFVTVDLDPVGGDAIRALPDSSMAFVGKICVVVAAFHFVCPRFEHFCALRQEASDLRQALEDRKLVERAKGVVMRRLAVDEEDAFRRLQKVASVHNHKLTAVARGVLASEEIFAELEHGGPRAGGTPADRARPAAGRRSPGKD